MNKNNLYVIAGPSGVGKGTLVKKILPRVPNVYPAVSATTRKPRVGEVDGKDYYFISESEFLAAVKADKFLEWATVYGCYYGTLKSEVDKKLRRGWNVLLEIDIAGARQIRKNYQGPAVFIFIAPPSIRALRRRLRKRGTESEAELQKRLKLAEKEISAAPEFDYQVVNDELDKAASEIVKIMAADC